MVCDQNKLNKGGCYEISDLVVEILSRRNTKKEIQNKYDLYEAGGREYWIVSYMHGTDLIQVLNEKSLF
ncbi:hypothetical protein [Nonlabens sp.]|uniref:hypothetical protein n=1 Tax=Nonlabens sp. TaxID=1888209 RepID=UPI0039E66EE3